MILLTRLDGHQIAVNEALILFAESTPDTVLTLAPGQRLIVKESLAEVVSKISASRGAGPGAAHG
ncbi:MAG: flagellar FlbD family protein [Myxococcaceae bacterium]